MLYCYKAPNKKPHEQVAYAKRRKHANKIKKKNAQ